MKNNSFKYNRLNGMTIGFKGQKDFNQRTLHGRITINKEEHHALFVQDKPRGQRSIEVMRTAHSRLVQRPDGNYTLTFRFSMLEENWNVKLVDEMKELCSPMNQTDFITHKPTTK